MNKRDLDIWWSSLTIRQKERIAFKGLSKTAPDGVAPKAKVQYPACSEWWNSLDEQTQIFIHDHCVDRHGYILSEWNEGNPYGN